MSTYTPDLAQDSLFDLPATPATPSTEQSAQPDRQPGHTNVPRLIARHRDGTIPLPGKAHPHRILDTGQVTIDTVWDKEDLTRVADPSVIRFTRDEAEVLVLAWALLHRYPPVDVGAHESAMQELRGYLDAFLTGHFEIQCWYQHTEAFYALSKITDVLIVRTHVPKPIPPRTRRRDAGVAAAKKAGWGPVLASLLEVRRTTQAARFTMMTGRLLQVSRTPVMGDPPKSWVV